MCWSIVFQRVILVVHELVLINTDSNMHGDKIKIKKKNLHRVLRVHCLLQESESFLV
jgi:hypothetical protein